MATQMRKYSFMKLDANEVYHEATCRGLRLIPRGNRLEVTPKSRLTPDFADVLRAHKAELLAFLEHSGHNAPVNGASWLHVAKQVLSGEFDGPLDESVRGSLETGLRSNNYPISLRALARLQRQLHNPRNEP